MKKILTSCIVLIFFAAAAQSGPSVKDAIEKMSDGSGGGGPSPTVVAKPIPFTIKSNSIVLGAGVYDGGSSNIYFPRGVSVAGLGPELTQVEVYNSSVDQLTNGGAFALADNCVVDGLFLNQTNPEQFILQPIGSQRKNQTAQTPANLAATSTNVLLQNVRAVGAKLFCVVMDSTNTMSWKIVGCDLASHATCPVVFGATPHQAGEMASAKPCATSNYLEIADTSLSVITGNGPDIRAGIYVNSPGTVRAILNNVCINRADTNRPAAVVFVAGTNTTVDLTINGAVTFGGAAGTNNTYDVYISGTNNTLICREGVTSICDVGVSNRITWQSSPAQLMPFANLINNSVSNLWTIDTNVIVSWGSPSAVAANKTWYWNNARKVYTNAVNGRFISNNIASGYWEMYSLTQIRQQHGALFGRWVGLMEEPSTVSPVNLNYQYGLTTNVNVFNGSTTNQLQFVGGILRAVVPR